MPAATSNMPEYWTLAPEQLLRGLGTSRQGLSAAEAAARLEGYGRNTLQRAARATPLPLLLHQFASPLALPYLPFAGVLGFEPLPPALLAALVGVTALYSLASEWAKR